MTRQHRPRIVTANALLEGDVVYLTADDRWSRDLAEAEILDDEAHAQIRLLDAEMRASEIVGPYLADTAPADNIARPAHFREEFRATGPSNYPHGKQAERKHV